LIADHLPDFNVFREKMENLVPIDNNNKKKQKFDKLLDSFRSQFDLTNINGLSDAIEIASVTCISIHDPMDLPILTLVVGNQSKSTNSHDDNH
jgi:hypothetical protein